MVKATRRLRNAEPQQKRSHAAAQRRNEDFNVPCPKRCAVVPLRENVFVKIAVVVCLICFSTFQSIPAQTRNLGEQLQSAATLIRDDRLPEAERELRTILRSYANQPDALNLLGAVRAKQRRFDEAEKLFSQAISVNAALVSARMNLAQLYLIQGKAPSAISEFNQILRLQPENDDVFNRLCQLLLKEKRFDDLINVIEQARSSRSISSSLLLTLGDAYLARKNAAKAEDAFRLALAQQDDDADAILGLAQAAQLRGDHAAVASYLERAKRSTLKSADTLHRFATVAWEAGRFEEANQALTEAVKIKPDDAELYVALGTTWLKKPDLVEAERAFRYALGLQADNPQTQMYLGYTLMLQGQYAAARELFEKSLATQATVPQTFYYLGLSLQEQGSDQAAILNFRKALELWPAYKEVHVALGRSYLSLKDYPRAQVELELAVKLDPDDIQAHYQLAVLYARLKDPERSQQQMQIVEQLKANGTQKTTP